MARYKITNRTQNIYQLPEPLYWKIQPNASIYRDVPATVMDSPPVYAIVNKGHISIEESNNPIAPDGLELRVGQGLIAQGVVASEKPTVFKTSRTLLYVDPVNGSDDADGSQATPMKTVQNAVYSFIPPQSPMPYWARGSDRVVSVVNPTNSVIIMDEYLHIPSHRGEGTLFIRGAEDVVHTLTQSGVTVLATGHFTHNTLNFVGGNPTVDSLADNSFVKPTNRSSTSATPSEAYNEDSPIVSNTTSSVETCMYGVGSWFGFGYGDAMAFDVVRPKIQWGAPNDFPSSQFSFLGSTLITIDGGRVIIEGFDFHGTVGGAFNMRSVINCGDTGSDGFSMLPVVFTRCIFSGRWLSIMQGQGLLATSCIFKTQSAVDDIDAIISAGFSCSIYNSRMVMDKAGAIVKLSSSCATVNLNGISFENKNAAGNGFASLSNSVANGTGWDLRGVGLQLKEDCKSLVWYISAEDVKRNVIELIDSKMQVNNCVGSTGNTALGYQLNGRSTLGVLFIKTLTGTAGDIKVGSNIPTTYAALPNTDITVFAVAKLA